MSRPSLASAALTAPVGTVKHIPTWFPGAKFKRDAAEWRKYPEELLSVPFARVQADMVSYAGNHRPSLMKPYVDQERGTAQPSMVAEALALDAGEDYNTVVKEAAAVMYLGGRHLEALRASSHNCRSRRL